MLFAIFFFVCLAIIVNLFVDDPDAVIPVTLFLGLFIAGGLLFLNFWGGLKNAPRFARLIKEMFDKQSENIPLDDQEYERRLKRAEQDSVLANKKLQTYQANRQGELANIHGKEITNQLRADTNKINAEIDKMNAEVTQILKSSVITDSQAKLLNLIIDETNSDKITPAQAHLLLKLISPNSDTGIDMGQEKLIKQQLRRMKAETAKVYQQVRKEKSQADLDELTVTETKKRYKYK